MPIESRGEDLLTFGKLTIPPYPPKIDIKLKK